MTVTRELVHLWVERAPVDPFDDDGPAQFRVVASVGRGATRRHVVPLTRAHDSEEQAMAVLASKLLHACTFEEARYVAALHEGEFHTEPVECEIGEGPKRRRFGR